MGGVVGGVVAVGGVGEGETVVGAEAEGVFGVDAGDLAERFFGGHDVALAEEFGRDTERFGERGDGQGEIQLQRGGGAEMVGAGAEPQRDAAGRAGEGRSVVVSRGHGLLIPGWCDGFRDRGSGGELVSCWLLSVSPVPGLSADRTRQRLRRYHWLGCRVFGLAGGRSWVDRRRKWLRSGNFRGCCCWLRGRGGRLGFRWVPLGFAGSRIWMNRTRKWLGIKQFLGSSGVIRFRLAAVCSGRWLCGNQIGTLAGRRRVWRLLFVREIRFRLVPGQFRVDLSAQDGPGLQRR
jgi:hypothetical protein